MRRTQSVVVGQSAALPFVSWSQVLYRETVRHHSQLSQDVKDIQIYVICKYLKRKSAKTGIMLKEYFNDGLIQIAIIISLLRMENVQLGNLHNADIEELLQGPMSAYTQTRFHHQNWNRGVGAFVHPKHIDNDINELLQDLHALGQYGNNRALNTRIEAYLVSNQEPPNVGSDAHVPNNHNHNASDNNNNNASTNNNGTASTAQGTNTGQNDQHKKEDAQPVGAELTREVIYFLIQFSYSFRMFWNVRLLLSLSL